MTQSYDVIVIGGGPAGSTAAAVLASKGCKTLLIEKKQFPRDKLCAGLLTWKSMELLRHVHDETAETLAHCGALTHHCYGYRIRYQNTVLSEGRTPQPFHFVSRRVFDLLLLNKAVSAGTEVRQTERVKRVDPATGTIVLENGETVSATYIIGADGATSVVRRSFPLPNDIWQQDLATALEIYFDRHAALSVSRPHADLMELFPTVYAGFIRSGYAWVFPHGDRLAVGIGGLNRSNNGQFRERFEEFLHFLGLEHGLGENIRGHALPYGNFVENPVFRKALLVGDAAGFVETLFGEGIYYAMRSAELAGNAVAYALETDTSPAPVYKAGLDMDIYPELVYSKRLRRIIYGSLRALRMLAPLKFFLRAGGQCLAEMVHGGRSYRFLAKRPYYRKSDARSGRAAQMM
ncbi:geranylgeranyl reductase family protein [Desulfovibrio inopinatus]|uniref:geranylgeranyl reductase family protein n=1 Tax=Desulfovibrio inopinatus TaxID=102109 RepID=UPI000407F4DF|nr:geranylgeranyl reductase family protein [Desulfovibrio inopinatus]